MVADLFDPGGHPLLGQVTRPGCGVEGKVLGITLVCGIWMATAFAFKVGKLVANVFFRSIQSPSTQQGRLLLYLLCF